ncbi:hypothetical protein KCH_48680 [Kitasatospora cheerisanensis KCTC 2395]|uniref:Uncharacterized protein n=1 Tax=Kitasatospora cheerisanensis KCTC 2395 TaxID=1348663 RepID=A0A066YZ64_9ACTN|nr:hypothetical protein KCH_48680 [Kitasatospora cheerisanensis KCTC 2395]
MVRGREGTGQFGVGLGGREAYRVAQCGVQRGCSPRRTAADAVRDMAAGFTP